MQGGVEPGAGEWLSRAEGAGRHPQTQALCLSVGSSGIVSPKEEGASGNATWRGACTRHWYAGPDLPFWGLGAAALSSHLPRRPPSIHSSSPSPPPRTPTTPHTPHSSLAQSVRPWLRLQVPILTRKKLRSRHR